MYLMASEGMREADMKEKMNKLRTATWLAALLIILLSACSATAVQTAGIFEDASTSTPIAQNQQTENIAGQNDPAVSISATPAVTSQVPPEDAAASPGASETPVPDAAEERIGEPLVQAAIQNLAERLKISSNEISIITVVPVNWSDASLGCPIPGQAYAQVVTPGYEVTLLANGQEYGYHTDIADRIVLCGEDGYPDFSPIPIPTDERIMDGQPWMPVD
jgi:hypothetical protein